MILKICHCSFSQGITGNTWEAVLLSWREWKIKWIGSKWNWECRHNKVNCCVKKGFSKWKEGKEEIKGDSGTTDESYLFEFVWEKIEFVSRRGKAPGKNLDSSICWLIIVRKKNSASPKNFFESYLLILNWKIIHKPYHCLQMA